MTNVKNAEETHPPRVNHPARLYAPHRGRRGRSPGSRWQVSLGTFSAELAHARRRSLRCLTTQPTASVPAGADQPSRLQLRAAVGCANSAGPQTLRSERLDRRTDRVWRNHTVEHEACVVAVLMGELHYKPSRPRRARREEGTTLIRELWVEGGVAAMCNERGGPRRNRPAGVQRR
jgi:hypothetical protein